MEVLVYVLGAIVAGVAIIALLSMRRVPDGQSFTVNRFGRFHRTLGPGLHFIVPLVDRVAHRVNILGQKLEVDCRPLKTKDEHAVLAHGVVYFQVLDPRKAAYYRRSVQEAARDLAESTTRELVEQMTFDALSHRTTRELNSWLLGMLNQSSTEWGVRITRIDLRFDERDLGAEAS